MISSNCPLVDVVIVSYNCAATIENCIDAIIENVPVSSISVLDNNSCDSTIQILKAKGLKQLNIIQSDKNLGFAAGNNIAAAKGNAKYLLFINSDAFVKSRIETSIGILSHNNHIGMVGAKMYGKEGEVRESFGRFPNIVRSIFLRKMYLRVDSKNTDRLLVDWVEGSFLLISRKLFEAINGFDEDYFLYFEDVDMCKRIKDLGYEVVVDLMTEYTHVGGYTLSRKDMLINSLFLYHKKHSRNIVYLIVRLAYWVKNRITKR